MRVAHHGILSLILALSWALAAQAADVQTNVGSYETLQTLTTSTAVNCGNAARHRTVPVVGTGAAPVDLSALNPQIVAGTSAGQLCDIVGTSATATVTLGHGNGLTLTKGAGTIVLGLDQTLPIKWTGAIWVQRGPVYDLTDTYTITPPIDDNVTITTAGTGEFIYTKSSGSGEVLSEPLTMASGSATWDGTFLECDGFPPCVFKGPTLEYRIYENGGIGQNGWFDRTTNLRVSTGLDIAAGNIDTVSGDGLPIATDDGTTAKRTVHGVVNYCEASGAGTDAYACNMLPALDRYVTGGLYFFKPTAFANVTGATIDFNGLGAKTIVKVAGGVTTALATNDIRVGQVVALQYDGTNMQLQSTLGNAASGSGDVVGDDTTTTAQNIVAYTGTGGKNITELTGTQGDVLYHTGTTWAKLAAGTSGNFLRTNGAGANPSWAAAAGGGGPAMPLPPVSAVPMTAGLTFGCIIDGDEMLCVPDATTLTGNATWRLSFQLPTTAWTCAWQLYLDVKTVATTGVIKINPAWASWAVGAARPAVVSEGVDADSVTGAVETTTTITFNGPANEVVRAKWTLNVTTLPATGERVALDLVIEDSGTTVGTAGQTVGIQPFLACE